MVKSITLDWESYLRELEEARNKGVLEGMLVAEHTVYNFLYEEDKSKRVCKESFEGDFTDALEENSEERFEKFFKKSDLAWNRWETIIYEIQEYLEKDDEETNDE